jgi:uncharacterized protein (DUF58 family)
MKTNFETYRSKISQQIVPVQIRVAGKVLGLFAGGHKSRMSGLEGDTKSSYRDYEPGDPHARIDFTLADMLDDDDHIQTILTEEQLRLNVYLLGDVSIRMFQGTRRTTKLDLMSEMLGSLIKGGEKTSDKYSTIFFSENRVEWQLLAKSARTSLDPALTFLYELQQKLLPVDRLTSLWRELLEVPIVFFLEPMRRFFSLFGGSKQRPGAASVRLHGQERQNTASGLCQALEKVPVNRSIVVILSDFATLTAKEKAAIEDLVRWGHVVYCAVVKDLHDGELSQENGTDWYEDANGQVFRVKVDETSRKQYRERYQKDFLGKLLRFFANSGCQALEFSTEDVEATLKLLTLFECRR